MTAAGCSLLLVGVAIGLQARSVRRAWRNGRLACQACRRRKAVGVWVWWCRRCLCGGAR